MKQIITLFIMVFACMTSTYAVTTSVAAADDASTTLTIDSEKHGFFGKAATFVAKKVNKIKNFVKSMDDDEIIAIVLIFIFAPLAVYWYEGKQWTNRVTINLILTLLFWLPGFIHALYIILGKK